MELRSEETKQALRKLRADREVLNAKIRALEVERELLDKQIAREERKGQFR